MQWIMLAFVSGILHAFDPDHLAAVTAFVKNNPDNRSAQLVGLRWGLGHTLSILAVGVLILALRLTIPQSFTDSMEFLVGAVLIVLGSFVINDLFKGKAHQHRHQHDGLEHSHFHEHGPGASHQHGHVTTLVGALHGLAGTASVLVLVPITLLASLELAVIYIAVFSFGTVLAMACYAAFLGRLLGSFSAKIGRAAAGLIGLFNIGLGIYFMLRVI